MDKNAVKSEKLIELVDYQETAVVSKEIIKKDSGTLSLFAFDTGQGLSEHTAPFDAFVHVLEGKAEITVSGKPHRVGSGEVIILPANQPHSVKAVQRFKMLLALLK